MGFQFISGHDYATLKMRRFRFMEGTVYANGHCYPDTISEVHAETEKFAEHFVEGESLDTALLTMDWQGVRIKTLQLD